MRYRFNASRCWGGVGFFACYIDSVFVVCGYMAAMWGDLTLAPPDLLSSKMLAIMSVVLPAHIWQGSVCKGRLAGYLYCGARHGNVFTLLHFLSPSALLCPPSPTTTHVPPLTGCRINVRIMKTEYWSQDADRLTEDGSLKRLCSNEIGCFGPTDTFMYLDSVYVWYLCVSRDNEQSAHNQYYTLKSIINVFIVYLIAIDFCYSVITFSSLCSLSTCVLLRLTCIPLFGCSDPFCLWASLKFHLAAKEGRRWCRREGRIEFVFMFFSFEDSP